MAGMKLRAEKKMRKHLIEQLKSRKVLGARIAQGDLKQAEELKQLNLAPQIFMFKNIFSGQVLYSQVPGYHQDQIDQQFVQPNWQNRKPSRRNDLWRLMCVVNFGSYNQAVEAYKGLVDLRIVRDVVKPDEADSMRKKNNEGNIWYAGQYRPTYSQEAVADLSHVIDEFNLGNTKIMWESLWRKGADEHWRADLVEHESLPPFNPKLETVLMDELREKALYEFQLQREQQEQSQESQESAEPQLA